MLTPEGLRQVMIAAAREFNAGRYFETHELLEDQLENVPDELWDLFLGLIQIAVGYHKATQAGGIGAAKMLALGLAKVEDYPANCAGLRLEPLRARVRQDLAHIEAGTFTDALPEAGPPRLQPLMS